MCQQATFSYLHNDQVRKLTFERVSKETVAVKLPDGTRYIVPYDHRDRRVMLIFDGDIPCDGLPKSASQETVLGQQLLKKTTDHARKARECELPHPHVTTNGQITIELKRRALLLPAGCSVIARYRDKSLAVWYCFVDVRYSANGPSITFRNGGY